MKYCVLSINGDIVKLESEAGDIEFVNLNKIPKGISVNDILLKTESGYTSLIEETEKRRKENVEITNSLWED